MDSKCQTLEVAAGVSERVGGFVQYIWTYHLYEDAARLGFKDVGAALTFEPDVPSDLDFLSQSTTVGGILRSHEELERILDESVNAIPRLEEYNIPETCASDDDCLTWKADATKLLPCDRFQRYIYYCAKDQENFLIRACKKMSRNRLPEAFAGISVNFETRVGGLVRGRCVQEALGENYEVLNSGVQPFFRNLINDMKHP
ncbi:uncharacterized protein LOC142350420 [Convolutriloba macropyga]|uniref:uncharacterized protein LOC142350420 n=1 Tax=Convolutriloba macropyga TaxID=536237 RepID=UPI003F527300